MTPPRSPDKPASRAEDSRKARLKAALKANIARRKLQAAARTKADDSGSNKT